MPDTPERHALLRFLGHNKGQKLVALCLAVLCWHAIHGAINHETVITRVPLSIQTDADWVVVDRSVDSVDIVVRGSQNDLLQLSRDRLRMDVTVAGENSHYEHSVALQPGNVTGPPGVRIVAVRPEVVELTLDRWETRQIPVKVDLATGTLPGRFAVERVLSDPAAIRLTGGRAQLDRIDVVSTERIDLSLRQQSFREQVALVVPEGLQQEHLAPRRVTVQVDISERVLQRTFEQVPVRAMTDPGATVALQVRPTMVRVVLRGPEAMLPGVRMEQVMVYVDGSGLESEGRYELPLQTRVPDGLAVESIHPQSALVTVSVP